CAEKITAAREAFDALSAGQKEFVTNYETLEDAEIAYAAYTQVENVAKIEDDEYATFLAACEAARTGDTVKLMADIDLTGEVAAYITLRRDITIDLNGHILNIKSSDLSYIVWASDGAIITIDNTVPERGGVKGILGADYSSGAGIVLHSCRLTLSIAELSKFDAFFSLDVDCVIADLNEGNPSVIGYSSIVYPIGDADYAAAVDGMIDAIGLVEYTDECQALIIAARDAYIALTDDQQLLVNNLATLEAAESNYATLAAAKIEALIADEITVVEKANIDAARAIYDSLNAQEKSYIGATFTKLHDAETTLAAIIAGYVANQEDCKHSLVQISSITGATTYSHDGTMRWYDYRDDEVLDGALGTRIHFPSNSGHNIAPGNVTVNMTAYLYEAREIEIWWKFEKGWCAQTDLTITSNTGSTTSRTIRLTQAYDGWNVEHISCPAGVSTFTFACSSQRPDTQVGTSGVDFYVIPQSYSMFGDGIICSQCGAVCKHESIGLAFDAETGEYYYVCNETYGCHHKVDLSTIPDEQESSFTSAREAYNALTDEQKALVIPSELLILEKHEAFKSVIENEQVAIQETNAVNNVIALLKKVPEAAEITVNDKTAIQAARTACDALTEEQKALIEQTLLDKLTAAESKYAELKEEDDTQKADAVTNVITALPAVDDITFENRSLIEQADVAYNMLTSDQKGQITTETKNV
ncbi:MAG: hypothetical protein IJ676_00670, partial [Clostridia bacterium]|nr:hypothetical protein [Clostridia bacterium]